MSNGQAQSLHAIPEQKLDPECRNCQISSPPSIDSYRDPKKHISISILKGYPYLIGFPYKGVYMGYHYPYCCFLTRGFICLTGLPYKGVYMGYPYPYCCFCAFLGPLSEGRSPKPPEPNRKTLDPESKTLNPAGLC